MASTVAAKTLKVTVTEQIQLAGNSQDNQTITEIADINELSNRIVTIPSSSEVGLLAFASSSNSMNAGTYVQSDVKYIRISNLDNTNFVDLRVLNTDGDYYSVKLDAGKSFLLGNTRLNTPSREDYVDPEDYVLYGYVDTLVSDAINADEIRARANTSNIDVEYLVAST
jgi:hypothetical protein